MAWSPEISQLSIDVTQLTNAVNVQKNLLSSAVPSAQSSRITANTGVAAAESSVVPSTTNMLSANTFKSSVLSIYGTQAVQQSSITNAAGQATAAAVSAVTATTGLTQDLSGITSQALHRSPNAITSMFVYDTSKDSDGGAWTEKCQHTSWYNETIYGKWLGPHISELYARYSNATLGSELITNGNFSNGSTGWTLSGFSIVDGVAVSNSSSIFIRQNVTTVAGKLYRVEYNAKLSASLVGSIVRLNSAGNLATTNVTGPNNAFSTVVEYVIAGSGTTGLEIITTAGSNIFSIDNVSVKEVIAINAASNDYFQLSTDGRFYRLWKNLFGTTAVLTNTSIWLNNNVGVAAQGGLNSVIKITPNTSNTTHKWGYNLTTDNTNAIFSIEAKADGYSRIALNEQVQTGNISATINLTDGTGGSASTIVTSLGDGWYRVSWLFTAINSSNKAFYVVVLPDAGVANVNSSTWTPNGTSGILVRNPQLEYGSVATSYELKTVSSTGISEVLRGNKRDFPRLAGIVAEAASVTIYDLTEAGRPMWMRFVRTVTQARSFLPDQSNITSVASYNGLLCIGSTGATNAGISGVDLCKDILWRYDNLFDRSGYDGVSVAQRALANLLNSTTTTIVNRAVNMVAMTVLPDAPIDPVTGLRVPTIAVATSGGVSVIRHNGTVVTPYGAESPYAEFTNDYRLRCKRAGTSAFYISSDWRTAAVPTAPLTLNATSAIPNISLNTSNKGFYAKKQSFMYYTGSGEVAILQENPATYAKGFVARVTNGFNTGWMHGDIRRTYLSDTEIGSATGPELVTNGGFDVNTIVWVPTSGSLSINAGWLRLTSSATPAFAGYSFASIPGTTYKINGQWRSSAGTWRFSIGTSAGGNQLTTSSSASSGTFTTFVQATTTTTWVSIRSITITTGDYVEIDNISVQEIIIDRSYKAQGANINGTLTRSQVATGTSLVGYSGFSTTNYLQEPYSADLDFGTGEFSASAWVNIPTTLPTSSFPVISSELISGNPTLTVGATFSTGVVTVTGTVGSSGSWLLSGHTAGKVYRVIFDVLEVQASGNSANIRVGIAGNEGLYNVISISTTGTKTVYFVATSGSTPKVTFSRSDPAVGQTRIGNVSTVEVGPAIIFDRAHSSGTRIRHGIIGTGVLTAEAFDGTTTRTTTTTSVYNTAQWLKAEVNYTTDGSLAIRVNGREVAVTRGNPLGNMTFGKNLLPYSNTLTPWSKGNSTVINPNIITPDGTIQTVSLYKDSIGTTAQSVVYDIGVAYATQVITVSVYVKRIDSDYFSIQISEEFNYQNVRAAFNITDAGYGLVNTFGTVTTSITPAGNGWFRVTMSGQSNNNNNAKVFFTLSNSVSGTSRAYAYNYTATGKSVYIYGAQAEVGSSATSFMATNIAPLTIGNSFTLNSPFPGSIALLKLGTTAPTPEQSTFMYEQEKQLFRPGALSVLPDANAIVDMSYDDATDRWSAVSTTNESYWNGLVRSSVTAVPAGAYSKITTTSGVELSARITTNPGVDVSIPPYALREEIVKRSEAASKLARKTVIYDYTGGFTGNITSGSTSILSAANITYPTSYIGARISGTGIPANTVITGVSGTTIYISAPATATTTALAITFLDFILPVGMEAKVVLTAGVIKREGSTSDYTRLFDGFMETIRFAVAPGSTAWVQIQATRTAQ